MNFNGKSTNDRDHPRPPCAPLKESATVDKRNFLYNACIFYLFIYFLSFLGRKKTLPAAFRVATLT